MVLALVLAYVDMTLAARPVGAMSTTLYPSFRSGLSQEAISVVLPVPAYPLSKKIEDEELCSTKAENRRMASIWSVVG